MHSGNDLAVTIKPFVVAARDYCALLDGMGERTREALLTDVYHKLPLLIAAAASLPDVSLPDVNGEHNSARLSNDEWTKLYQGLKQTLGEWDSYRKVFDPTTDTEAMVGSLADDLADIYRDVAEGLSDADESALRSAIFNWRVLFYSHWGKHAIDALEVLHRRISESLM